MNLLPNDGKRKHLFYTNSANNYASDYILIDSLLYIYIYEKLLTKTITKTVSISLFSFQVSLAVYVHVCIM